jgi:hypothetical protein
MATGKVSEKSLELNVGAEILALARTGWGMPKAYLRGLTQAEENREGVDFFLQLDPATRIVAFQFKAPKGSDDTLPYRYTLRRKQHQLLYQLAQASPRSVFYVFPYYVTVDKLQQDVPDLIKDTWLLSLDQMQTAAVFGPAAATRTVRCQGALASVNPDYEMGRVGEVSPPHGLAPRQFAAWYSQYRDTAELRQTRRDPWLARGLRVAIVLPEI